MLRVRAVDEASAAAFEKHFGISPVLASLLAGRGMTSITEAESFLNPRIEDLSDPLLLPDVKKAVERVVAAIRAEERIGIFGDYDADGVTSTALMLNFLGQAIDTDLVIIYFAGHGMPEPSRPQNTYLLTYDTDPNILGTTAFPMWQIQDVLGRYINAKRIVVFSDACHSGAISVNFATRGLGVAENNLVNQYLTDLAKSKEGTVVFTASAAGEVSQEFPDLGHGVFTYYLLEGLQGRADYNNDYVITINEIMQYVEEQVKRKTKGAQNPTRSQTTYDKELTIATIAH